MFSLELSKKQLILLSDFINAGFQFVDGCELVDLSVSPGYSDLKDLKSKVDDLIEYAFALKSQKDDSKEFICDSLKRDPKSGWPIND